MITENDDSVDAVNELVRKISIKETQLNQFISSFSNAQIIYLTHEATFYGMGYSHLRNNCVRRGMIK
jgi:hypothetical protein